MNNKKEGLFSYCMPKELILKRRYPKTFTAFSTT